VSDIDRSGLAEDATSSPPHQHAGYQARVARARRSNELSLQKEQAQASEDEMLDGITRISELRTRLKILSERDPSNWGLKEMKGALAAAGVNVGGEVGRAELVERTKAMADRVRRQWAAGEAVEAAVKLAKQPTKSAKRKFRTRGARRPNAAHDDQTPQLSDWSDDDSCDGDEDRGAQPSSFRAAFRQRGSSHGAKPKDPVPKHADADAEDPLARAVYAMLVPSCAKGTDWANAVGQCLALPSAASHVVA